MKTIGLIGGLSWQSSAEYYRIINEEVNRRLGGNHSASLLMYSFDFESVEKKQAAGEWASLDQDMARAAMQLESAGADLLLIGSNTMHRCLPAIKKAVTLPVLHIVDGVGEALAAAGIRHAGLLGTRFLMEDTLYPDRLEKGFGIRTTLPEKDRIPIINRIIYEELVKGVIREDARQTFREIIDSMTGRGIEAVILGCTEIPLLIKQQDVPVPVFDTTLIHAGMAVDHALSAG